MMVEHDREVPMIEQIDQIMDALLDHDLIVPINTENPNATTICWLWSTNSDLIFSWILIPVLNHIVFFQVAVIWCMQRRSCHTLVVAYDSKGPPSLVNFGFFEFLSQNIPVVGAWDFHSCVFKFTVLSQRGPLVIEPGVLERVVKLRLLRRRIEAGAFQSFSNGNSRKSIWKFHLQVGCVSLIPQKQGQMNNSNSLSAPPAEFCFLFPSSHLTLASCYLQTPIFKFTLISEGFLSDNTQVWKSAFKCFGHFLI